MTRGSLTKFTGILFILTAFALPANAQTDPCLSAVTPFIVTSGAPYTVTLLMDAQVPVSPTDPTLVDQRIDGYYLQIDLQIRTKLTISQVTVLPACGSATPNPGKIPTTYKTISGVPRGSHTLKLNAFNFTLDANGIPTTTEQEGPVVSTPFVAADLLQSTPPRVPTNIIIRK